MGTIISKNRNLSNNHDKDNTIVAKIKKEKTVTTSTDEKVKVSTNDTTSDYLISKLSAGSVAITVTEINDGGNEQISIDLNQGQIDHTSITNIGANSHVQIDNHIANSSNPHSVTATQVYNTTAQWNADQIQGVSVSSATPSHGDVLTYNSATSELEYTNAAYPPGYVHGLEYWRYSASEITIGKGHCRDDANTYNLDNAGEITISVATTGANGLDTGSESSSTWYSLWLIGRPSTGSVGGLLSIDETAPSMPTNWTKRRRIGWARNDGSSNFLRFGASGIGQTKLVMYDEWWTVLNNGTALSFTAVDCSAYICPTSRVGYLRFRPYDPGAGAAIPITAFRENGAGTSFGFIQFHTYEVSELMGLHPVSFSQSVDYAVYYSGDNTDIRVQGFLDDLYIGDIE